MKPTDRNASVELDRRADGSICPAMWLQRAAEQRRLGVNRRRGTTRWISGAEKPARRGWYERLFTDGLYRHWWSGTAWSHQQGGIGHWRQVGSYPCWRGLTCMAFMRGKTK